jgi:tetratricopeptide (TPR) repeat protein
MSQVYRAAESNDWERVVTILEALHEHGLATGMSRHWLGIAFLKLGRWQDAFEEYEKIGKPLGEKDANARRILNHAFSYYQLGDSERCAQMLRDGISPDWPLVDLQKAKQLLNEIEVEH